MKQIKPKSQSLEKRKTYIIKSKNTLKEIDSFKHKIKDLIQKCS